DDVLSRDPGARRLLRKLAEGALVAAALRVEDDEQIGLALKDAQEEEVRTPGRARCVAHWLALAEVRIELLGSCLQCVDSGTHDGWCVLSGMIGRLMGGADGVRSQRTTSATSWGSSAVAASSGKKRT